MIERRRKRLNITGVRKRTFLHNGEVIIKRSRREAKDHWNVRKNTNLAK